MSAPGAPAAPPDPAPPSLSAPTKYGDRTRAIRRALVGHVRVRGVATTLTDTGSAWTTVTPVDDSPAGLHMCGERLLAQVPWLSTVTVDRDQGVVVAISLGATR